MEDKKVYKDESYVEVYQEISNPDFIYKKYLIDANVFKTKEDLKLKRQKLMAMKRRKEWPDFVIRPTKVYRLNPVSFKVEFPYINGIDLDNYLQKNDIDILTCAKLIKSMEEKIYHEKEFVFPDIANPSNIMIVPGNKKDELQFKIIDPDDIQFDEYKSNCISGLIFSSFMSKCIGFNKCMDGNKLNKQVDIRSMYGLLYYIVNGFDYFYPLLIEREDIAEYEMVLEKLNIPKNSSLYEKTMNTLDEGLSNEIIGNSLFELIEDGYRFETYGKSRSGYRHRLVKR